MNTVPVLLSVIYKTYMLSIVMLNVVMLSVVMLIVIMLNVIMLNVVAPFDWFILVLGKLIYHLCGSEELNGISKEQHRLDTNAGKQLS